MPRTTPRKEEFRREELFPSPHGRATETVVVPDPEFASVDNSRPDLDDENEDGLDEMTEEVRHQAEDFPTGSGRAPIDGIEDEPVEPSEAIDNQAVFPGLDDQGESQPKPARRSRRKS